MSDSQIPQLAPQDRDDGLLRAEKSTRRRYPKILHAPSAGFNRVVNFFMQDSYMQPHLHPAVEKIEHIFLIEGRLAVIFFDDRGAIKEIVVLEKGRLDSVQVPAFTWHTYVMLSEHVISYETMAGVYDPKTWKQFADWAPREDSPECLAYLTLLHEEAASWAAQMARPASLRS